VINADRAGDNAVMAFEQWITVMAGQETMPFEPVT
jgi:hypothetical protein